MDLQNFQDCKKLLNIELKSFIQFSMDPTVGPGANIELQRLLN